MDLFSSQTQEAILQKWTAEQKLKETQLEEEQRKKRTRTSPSAPLSESSEEDESSYEEEEVEELSSSEEESSSEEVEAPRGERGVVYIARVPPYMGPTTMKGIMSRLGLVKRVYLETEDEVRSKERRRKGGCRKPKYTHGWVEFASARRAQRVAATLDGTPLGDLVSRKSPFREDLWSLKYLPGFHWDDLKREKTAAKTARDRKLREGVRNAARDARALQAQFQAAQRKRKRMENSLLESGSDGPAVAESSRPPVAGTSTPPSKMGNSIRQRRVVDSGDSSLAPELLSLLSL